MILLIDNYDSFTYNLYQYLCELGAEVSVVRNDQISIEEIADMAPEKIVVSPGPNTPEKAGISNDVIRHFGPETPTLGVCLGHQSIAQAFGGRVVRAERLMHGKTSEIHHDGKGIFEGLPNPFTATRYHSLIVDRASVGEEFQISAWTADDELMGLRWVGGRNNQSPMDGVQFHPESFLTNEGPALLANFLGLQRPEPVVTVG